MKNLPAIYYDQPREDIREQLKELSTISMMQIVFPNLSILANVCLTIPVGTASVECSFSHMKIIKSRLRNQLRDANFFISNENCNEIP